jgi:formate dehydrogenase subunit gamma
MAMASACVAVLLVSGLIAWRQYFAGYFPIPVVRLALLAHASAAVALIAGIIVHVYAALWVKGTIRAMVEGVVTHAWAKKHHPRWYREMTGKKS